MKSRFILMPALQTRFSRILTPVLRTKGFPRILPEASLRAERSNLVSVMALSATGKWMKVPGLMIVLLHLSQTPLVMGIMVNPVLMQEEPNLLMVNMEMEAVLMGQMIMSAYQTQAMFLGCPFTVGTLTVFDVPT